MQKTMVSKFVGEKKQRKRAVVGPKTGGQVNRIGDQCLTSQEKKSGGRLGAHTLMCKG